MSHYNLNAEVRKEFGKNEAGRLRREGLIPCNLLDGGKSTLLSINDREFSRLIQSGLRQSSLIELNANGQKERVIVKEIQRDPVSNQILHIDFLKVVNGKKVLLTVAVELTGQSKGVKAGGALEQYINKIKVRATPETFVDVITVDVTELDVAQSVHLRDLGAPSSWELLLEGNPIVVKVAQGRTATADSPEAGAAAKS
ncbi:MAG: 50S ribosomal protein L25 [Leptospirales bacterium]|nr:50S ribosomal protein L25 [Leptospirales bacterium]